MATPISISAMPARRAERWSVVLEILERMLICFFRRATYSALILRSRALARRLEGWKRALVADPSRRGQEAAPQDEGGACLHSKTTAGLERLPRSLSYTTYPK